MLSRLGTGHAISQSSRNNSGTRPSERRPDMMKTNRSIFQTHGILVAVLTMGAPFAMAQTVDTSTGTILDSTASRSAISPENPAPTRLTASVTPINKDATINGEITFVLTGSAVSVAGRISGMETNKRYHAVVWSPAAPAVLGKPATVNPSSEARPPAAESPPTGSPAPATPTANPGTADPTARPANSTTVTTSGPQSIELDLGTLVSDANGTANLNSSISNKDLTTPPAGILGCVIVIKRAPPLDSIDERSPVASGVISVPGKVAPAPDGP